MAATITHLTASAGAERKGKGFKKLETDPLQRFGEAKKCMCGIYNEIEIYLKELSTFYSKLDDDNKKFVPSRQLSEVERYLDTIKTIKEMVGRDKMKVVFFGRTSNGKSTVINAMLSSKILPQGMGHTTCCFLQIEGGQENEKYFVIENAEEKKLPIGELHKVGHALGNASDSSSLGTDSLIRIIYPKSASKLLQNDLAIVDSPGVDLSPEFDGWIDRHCLDADVFVLVCNSEATLTQAEKNFFIRVSEKLSKPNVFILCNRWDASASEADEIRAQIRDQHERRFVHFLSSELQVCTPQKAADRYFFISALEMLDQRLYEHGELKKNLRQLEGHQRRAGDFRKFEECFEECISKSAIHTKFAAHNRRAREIVSAMLDNVDATMGAGLHEKQRLVLDFQLKTKEHEASAKKFKLFERTFTEEQKKMRSEVLMKVSSDFEEEIARLEAIVDHFKHPFVDDPVSIQEYKKELALYLNEVLTEELQNQCTGALITRIWSLENSMLTFIRQLVDETHAVELDKIWLYKQPFKFVISVNCPKMVDDFHEDLEFRFSLGIESIARKILSITRGQPITAIDRNILQLGSPRSSSASRTNTQPNKQEVDMFLANLLVQSATYLVNGSVVVTVAGLVIYKNVDWRWILSGVGAVAGFYCFERLRWDNGAKEERLKTQFRQHLEQRLRQAEGIHTEQCEKQVIQELDGVCGGLKKIFNGFYDQTTCFIEHTKNNIGNVDKMLASLTTIKNKINFVSTTLNGFNERFLDETNSS
ncbi:Dynamin-type G domain-containing protein [Meloidogyne graminicola]|uniref:Dynamin-type G domain-containing protein n=1 Tax=Meloidogyne graminicola TaxID=189291 RepID=A0A8S9ZL54_9BILA|nr:Dynamin-type G domain-containing protein [Meloidogyne graminicola]